MNSQKKIFHFKLNAQIIEKLKNQKQLFIENVKSGLEIVLDDSRININVSKDKKQVPTAIYYNNNAGNLHFLGEGISSTATLTKTPVKSTQDIPHTVKPPIPKAAAPTPPPTTNTTTNNIKKQPIPSSTPPTRPQKPTKPPVPNATPKKAVTSPFEEKYSIKTRILQRLALQPWSGTEIVKSIDRRQQEKCDQLEVKHILETVAIPIKKGERNKYCLKPTLYKDIQIWSWPFYSSAEKLTVADNAKEAYDLLQSKGMDVDRSNLYHPDSPYKPPIRKPTPQLQEKGKKPTLNSPAPTTPLTMELKPHTPNTPIQKSTTPIQKSSTPIQKSNTPIQKSNTPIQKSNTPIQKSSTPTQKSSTPIQKSNASNLKPPSASKKPVATITSSKAPQPLIKNKRKHEEDDEEIPKKKIQVPKAPIEPVDIKTQRQFEAYCHKYKQVRMEYIEIKDKFKLSYPDYIKVLESTEPPKGTQRSYFDLNLEYQNMLRSNYKGNRLREIEESLSNCNNKRRRLKYMWTSIKQNIEEHHYKVPKN